MNALIIPANHLVVWDINQPVNPVWDLRWNGTPYNDYVDDKDIKIWLQPWF